MSTFDGTKLPLTYADALAEIAKRVPWGREEQGAEVVKAIQVEHGVYVVPEAETKAAEIERLRVLAAEADRVAAEEAQDAELAALRERLGIVHGADPETEALATA